MDTEGPAGAEPGELVGLSAPKDPELEAIVVNRRGNGVRHFKKDVAQPMKSARAGSRRRK
ncbi:hypothetical protein ACIRP2_31990 [Streptomyces sp. NPDC101194]|uniref:hypothetical protein n=1 Tax=Streptomyces sp. NPDC101194 TaxID=3366127 RepID=UPI0037FCF810